MTAHLSGQLHLHVSAAQAVMRFCIHQECSACSNHHNPGRTQVIDLISLKPFDLEAITRSVKKTRKCIIVEECMKTGGIGASLSAVINESLFNELDHEVSWELSCD